MPRMRTFISEVPINDKHLCSLSMAQSLQVISHPLAASREQFSEE